MEGSQLVDLLRFLAALGMTDVKAVIPSERSESRDHTGNRAEILAALGMTFSTENCTHFPGRVRRYYYFM